MATLPEYLTDQSEEVIRQRMLDEVSEDIDKSEGSYIWDSLSPASIQFALAAIWAQEVLKRGFASTTYGEYLDLRCEEHGLTRKPAVKAIGQVTFTGTVGILVPQGTPVATPADSISGQSSIQFVTTAQATIGAGGTVTVNIEASEAGAAGNVSANSITIMVTPISGVTSVTNASATEAGTDIETDADLLVRFFAKVQTPGTSGNKADYINWALEVAGVGAAQVIPLWNGAGTVKVVLLGTDKLPAGAQIVSDTQNYISPNPALGEGKAPIGATVTVVAATAVSIGVTATVVLTGTKTLQEITTAFESALVDYLASIAFTNDPVVRYVRIGSMLLDTEGVQDYSNLLVNGGAGNINIVTGEVGVKGTVTLS